MKRVWHHIGGIVFDGACVVAGFGAAFIAAVADYTGTHAQFWFFRLAFSTLPLVLVALASTLLRHERPWRCWLRFAFFEWQALWIAVASLDDISRGRWGYGGHFLPAVLLDAAVFLMVLSVSRFRVRTVA
jgi:hypothetical protein